jgi:hypothetical protein
MLLSEYPLAPGADSTVYCRRERDAKPSADDRFWRKAAVRILIDLECPLLGAPQLADILRVIRHVRKVPMNEPARLAARSSDYVCRSNYLNERK